VAYCIKYLMLIYLMLHRLITDSFSDLRNTVFFLFMCVIVLRVLTISFELNYPVLLTFEYEARAVASC